MRSERYQKTNRKKTIIRLTILLIFMALFAIGGISFGYNMANLNNFFNQITSSEANQNKTDSNSNLLDANKPFSVLLLGADVADSGDNIRTDTIIVATINPHQESIKLVSIPRDLPVELSNGGVEKINATYSYGGIDYITEELENLLDIPISQYAIIDFQGFVNLIDAVDGITVNSDFAFTVDHSDNSKDEIVIKKGRQRLDGEEALGYSRMRKQDPRGDFGRQKRQQEVLKSLADEVLSVNGLINLSPILKAVGPHLKTGLSGDNMMQIASDYQAALNNIDSLQIEGEDSSMYFPHYGFSVYTFEPFDESIKVVQEELQAHLEVKGKNSF